LDRWFDEQSDAQLIGGFKPSVQGVVADVFVRLVPVEPGPTPGSAYEVKLYLRQEPDPPPLPPPTWPVFMRTDGARKDLQDAIFAAWAAWHEGDDSCDQAGARPLPEHVLGQDPASVFLARLVLPATLPASDARPVRTAREVVVDNRSRDRPLTDRAGRVAGQRTTRPHTVVITTGAWSLVPTSASTTQALARAATVGDASM